jgi:RNase P subunit RPR2
MKCYFCKKKIRPEEKTATVTSHIGDWTSEPHVICQKCAWEIRKDAKKVKESGGGKPKKAKRTLESYKGGTG